MKLVFALAALILAAGGITYAIWRAAPEVPPCQDAPRTSVVSPDGAYAADVFEEHCDASVTTHVALRRAAEKARKDVFVAASSVPVSAEWRAGQLWIDSPAKRVIIEETSWRGIAVRRK